MIKKIISIILIIGNILLSSTSLVEAKTNIITKNIKIEDGLAQATVESIYQDSKGYMWFGTNDGLNRYNGYDFKLYHKEVGSKVSLTSNYIKDIVEDIDLNLWVVTLNGLNKFNKDRTEVKQYWDIGAKGNLSSNKLSDMLITKDGKILVASYKGIDIYNKEEDKFQPFVKDLESLRGHIIYTLDEDDEGNIWIGGESGIDVVDKNGVIKDSFIYDNKYDYIFEESIKDVYSDKNGIVWVGTESLGATKIDTFNESIEFYTNKSEIQTSIPSNCIRNFFRDKYDNLWISTSNGLAKYNSNKNSFYIYNHNIYNNQSLSNDITYLSYQDKNGFIWVGTHSGISIFHPKNTIKNYKSNIGNDFSLSEQGIQSIYEIKNGLVFIATHSKGIDVLDRSSDRIIYNLSTKTIDNFTNDSVNSIVDDNENIYIGTNNGLNIINKITYENTVLNVEQGLVDEFIKRLYLDGDYLWIGTAKGFDIYNIKDRSIININKILTDANVKYLYSNAITKDSEGVYWLGMFFSSGLVKLDPNTKNIDVYLHDESNPKSISDDIIYSIVEAEDGDLWIGTSMGLNKFNKETEEFQRYTTKDGLPNDMIYGILLDEDNNPWMSTNGGISKYDINTKKFINFDVTDGLQSNEFNDGAYYKASDGRLFFGGIEGVNSFNPKGMFAGDYISDIIFDEFKVNGQKVLDIDGKEFSSTDNTITVKVFLPEYKNPKNIKYYYTLGSGDDAAWFDMNRNQVTLANLSSGKYRLRIKARNSNGVFSDENQVEFRIKPPIWRSNSAIMLYILIGILIYYREKSKVKRLDKKVKIRTKELSEEIKVKKELFDRVLFLERGKNSYFVNLSHELRTPLNVLSSLQQVIYQLNKSEEHIDKNKLDHYMKVADKNIKRLLKIINDLIDTSKIENGNYIMNFKDNNIISVVEEAALSLKDYVESKGVTLIIDPEIEEKIIKCDSVEIERCIVNLVGNANKFTPKGGIIEVSIKDLDNKVKIEVKDTGVGIPKPYQEVVFNRFSQVVDVNSEVKKGSGLGLTITKHIINLHGGTIQVESEVGKGSNFIIILPVNNN